METIVKALFVITLIVIVLGMVGMVDTMSVDAGSMNRIGGDCGEKYPYPDSGASGYCYIPQGKTIVRTNEDDNQKVTVTSTPKPTEEPIVTVEEPTQEEPEPTNNKPKGNNGNHYGNDKPDNNDHDCKNKHDTACD